MNLTRMTVLACTLAFVFGCTSAQAADLFGKRSASSKDLGFRPTLNSGAKWYVRLDAGVAAHSEPTLTGGSAALTGEDYDPTWAIGFGVGRYFSPKLRADLTYDYRFASDVSANAGGGLAPGGRNFELANHLLMANLYYDFNRSGRFNPYIGAGLGIVNHAVEAGTNAASGATVASHDEWQFAAALMAGMTLKFGGNNVIRGSVKDGSMHMAQSRQIFFDLGYRYLYLGDAQTGRVSTAANGVIASGLSVDDIHAHEFRFGLRFDLR